MKIIEIDIDKYISKINSCYDVKELKFKKSYPYGSARILSIKDVGSIFIYSSNRIVFYYNPINRLLPISAELSRSHPRTYTLSIYGKTDFFCSPKYTIDRSSKPSSMLIKYGLKDLFMIEYLISSCMKSEEFN